VVPHRALRNAELDRELLRGSCALPQQADDAAAEVAAERAELLGILDEEDVFSGVVDKRTVDDCRPYGKSRPFVNSRCPGDMRPGICGFVPAY
jgi:hypothetical protein